MKKFQFSLDNVLGYKQQVLENLQNEHAMIMQRVRQQEEHLEQTTASYHDCNRQFRQAEAEGITVAEALRFESGLRFWEKEIESSRLLLQKYRQEAEEKRKQVVAARQDTASLENLKEKKHEAYLEAAQKGEERTIEELVNTKRVMAALMG